MPKTIPDPEDTNPGFLDEQIPCPLCVRGIVETSREESATTYAVHAEPCFLCGGEAPFLVTNDDCTKWVLMGRPTRRPRVW